MSDNVVPFNRVPAVPECVAYRRAHVKQALGMSVEQVFLRAESIMRGEVPQPRDEEDKFFNVLRNVLGETGNGGVA